MQEIKEFISAQEEKKIVEAITLAEKSTSGEIRVHIEIKSSGAPFERAKQIFEELGMANTKYKNGVLFYVSISPKYFVILGDKGLDDKVKQENFWEGTKELVINHFQQGLYAQGLIHGIEKAGVKLKQLFPSDKINLNELPNEISKS